MLTDTRGLVIRVTDVKENDRIITVYTEKQGIVSAYARGARSVKSRKLSSTALLSYSDFVFEGEGEMLKVKEAVQLNSFYGVRDSLDALALSMYICEVLTEVGTEEADTELLRLSLNSLYALAENKHPPCKIKAAFEMRCAALLGLSPEISGCRICGCNEGELYFDVMAGGILCGECRGNSDNNVRISEEHEASVVCILTPSARAAIEYTLNAPLERLFSFNLNGDDMHLFCRAAEAYLLNHLERGFNTLDFYNEVKR